MKRLFAIQTMLLLLAVSCSREEDAIEYTEQEQATEASEEGQAPEEQGLVKLNFSAELERVKTTIDDDGKVQWEEGDEVRIYWSDDGSATMTALQTGAKTDFSEVSVGVADCYYAVYPDSDQSLDTDAEEITLNIPSDQDGSFSGANYIVGRTLPGSSTIYFYYACSVVKFNITRSDITELTLRSADGSAIVGSVTADFSAVAASSDTPVFTVTDGSDEITLPISGAGTYYVAILPGKAIAGGLLFRARTGEDYLPAAATGLNQASVRGKVKNYVLSGGMDSKIVTDYYVSASGSGNKNGKSSANAFDIEAFENFVGSRASDAEASRSQAFRLYGTKIHVNGTLTVDSPISIGFSEGAYEKLVEFTFDGGVLSGGDACSILSVGQGTTLNLAGMTLSGGNAGSESGGAVRIGSSSAKVIASDCVFSGNSALEGGTILISAGSLEAVDCTFSGNEATVAYNYRGGGAVKLQGASALADFHRCSFTSNTTSGGGGAICCSAGSARATKCSFAGNSAGKYGGCLNAEGSNASIFLSKCKISGNSAGGWGMSVNIGEGATFAVNGSVIYGNSSSGSNDASLFIKGNSLICGTTIIEDVEDRAVVHLAGTASTCLAGSIVAGRDETDMAFYMDGTTHGVTSYGGSLIGRISGASLAAAQAFSKNIADIYNYKYSEFSGAAWNPETLVFSWTNGSIYGFYPAKQEVVNTALAVFGNGFSAWATGVDTFAFTKDISGHARTSSGLRPGAWEGNNNAMSSSPKRLSVGHLLGYYQWGTSATGVLVMAHRCHVSSENQTENSISAARQALAAGADILEVDPRRTQDGEIILCHDKSIEDIVATFRSLDDVDEMSLSKIQSYQLVNRKWFGSSSRYLRGTGEHIPTLSEFLSGIGSPRTWYLSLDCEKIISENPSSYAGIIHTIADIVNTAGMMEHTLFYVHKSGASPGEDKVTALRNSFAQWGYPNAAIETYPYGNSPDTDCNYQWVRNFPQNAYSARASYSPGASPHNLLHVVKDGMVGVVNCLHILNSTIPEYSLDASQLDELLTNFPYCHVIQTDCPAEMVTALAAKGLRVSRYEDEFNAGSGFDGYNSGNYNW